jgi:hypothetical protein
VEEEGSFGHLVNWNHFSLEKFVTKKGEEKKKLTLVYRCASSTNFIQYLKPKLQHFVRHNFVAHWQDIQFKNCFRGFSSDTTVLVIFLSENYTFNIQNEVQNIHWHSYQVTSAHNMVAYSKPNSKWWRLWSINEIPLLYHWWKDPQFFFFNIVCFYIGKSWWIMCFNPNTITWGQMATPHNSRAKFHGFL